MGWLGTLFEYGIIGTVLIFLLYLTGFRLGRQTAALDGPEVPFRKALADYGLYLLIVSTIYSAVFTPGEIASIAAIALYCVGIREGASGGEPA